MDRGAWWATVNRIAKSQIQLKLLSTHTHLLIDSISKYNHTAVIDATQELG